MIELTNEEAYKKYGQPNSNEKNNFINWDAVNSLPEEMEPSFTTIRFDPKNLVTHFTNVGTDSKPSWYPTTDMMYDIAKAAGIQGETYKTVEPIFEEVDYNIVLMIPDGPDVNPCMRKIKTGVRVTKQSSIIEPDNTRRLCSPESNEFNFFARACIAFLNEESNTNNYTKKGRYDNKYDTPIKRKKCLLELEKFALQQAETKAFVKTVRVLAGLPTGFTTDDLKSGELIFVKFLKSKKYLKLEMSARLTSIANGRTPEIKQISGEIFGDEKINTDIVKDVINQDFDVTLKNVTTSTNEKQNSFIKHIEPVKTDIKREEYILNLKSLLKNDIIKNRDGAVDYINKTLNNIDDKSDVDLKKLIDAYNKKIDEKKTEEEEIF